MDHDFKAKLHDVMASRLPQASGEWVASLETALWDAGFRVPGEHACHTITRLIAERDQVLERLKEAIISRDGLARASKEANETNLELRTERDNALAAEKRALDAYHRIYHEIGRIREQREEWHRKYNQATGIGGSGANMMAGGGSGGIGPMPVAFHAQGGGGGGAGSGLVTDVDYHNPNDVREINRLKDLCASFTNLQAQSYVVQIVRSSDDIKTIEKLTSRLNGIKSVIERYFYIEPTVEWQNAHNLILQRVADAANMKIFPVPAQEASITVTMED